VTFTIQIHQGEKEPIVVLVVDTNGLPLPGKTNIKIKIRRNSDGFYFDWSDNTFKTSVSVASLVQALVEVSPTASPGEYELNRPGHIHGFDTSTIVNPNNVDDYFITCIQDGGSDATNVPMMGELKVAPEDDTVDHTPVIW